MDELSFSEDELFVPTSNFGPNVKVFNLYATTTKETNFNVLLELSGVGPQKDTLGVDIVTVIDVSESMNNHIRLENVKTAMKCLIEKLTPIHRLSVVTFSTSLKWVCPLRQMTKNAQVEIKKLVEDLVADGSTNIATGLETAIKVLAGRRLSHGRVSAVILMSSGDESHGNASHVSLGDVPVYTFNVGATCESDVLNTIANNSKGGTYSIVSVENLARDKLSDAVGQCLAGILTVIVQDLKLTIIPVKLNIEDQEIQPKIKEISNGKYPQSTSDVDGSISISFGDLYKDEKRNVFLDLFLPAVSKDFFHELLQITHSYSIGTEAYQGSPLLAGVRRTSMVKFNVHDELLLLEKARLEVLELMGMAIQMCDNDNFDDAKDKLQEAIDLIAGFAGDEPDKEEILQAINMSNLDKEEQPSKDKILEEFLIVLDQNHPFPSMKKIKKELKQLLELTESPEEYKRKGRHFALATQTSHNRQRFATRDDLDSPFATSATNMVIARTPEKSEVHNNFRYIEATAPGPSLLGFKAKKGGKEKVKPKNEKGKQKPMSGKGKEKPTSGKGKEKPTDSSLPKPQTLQRGPINR